MKTAQLPPVRVEPSAREEIEAALHDGETLSEFIESAALQAARRRKAQQAFIARGRASLERARETGRLIPLGQALDGIESRLQRKVADRLATASKRPPKR